MNHHRLSRLLIVFGIGFGFGAGAYEALGQDRLSPPPDKDPQARATRVTLCHRRPDGRFSTVTVSPSGVADHLAHGDCRIDDAISCTSDSCHATQGCLHTPNSSQCNDSVACTVDTCNVTSGCQYTPDDSLCDDDGQFCTRETCTAGSGCGVIDRCSAFTDTANCLSYGRCDEANQDCPADPLPDCCGNGIIEAGEECDDGNTDPGDGCDAACQIECAALQVICTSDAECCDTGAGAVCGADFCGLEDFSCCFPTGTSGCGEDCDCCDDDLCTSGVCTDPVPPCAALQEACTLGNSGEECCDFDDGAVCGNDFCGGGSFSCCFPTGTACPSGADCDCCDDDLCVGGVCSNPPGCGNGTVDAGEECDDSNLISGDGCDATCQDECSALHGSCASGTDCCGGSGTFCVSGSCCIGFFSSCNLDSDCCGSPTNATCIGGVCTPPCRDLGLSCNIEENCCEAAAKCLTPNPNCGGNVAGVSTVCCLPLGNACTDNCDCCGNSTCSGGVCTGVCRNLEEPCTTTSDCCNSGAECHTSYCWDVPTCCVPLDGACEDDCECCGLSVCFNFFCVED